jgi:S1-C subfamily serine protease
MRKVPLYSSSSRRGPAPTAAAGADGDDTAAPAAVAAPRNDAARPKPRARLAWRSAVAGLVAGLAVAAFVVAAQWRLGAPARTLTQKDIDAAVLHTLETRTLPSPAARAYEIVRPSVVLVRGQREGDDADLERSIGTGVVIVDSGIVLTNLHVVSGADKIGLRFADGTESEASLISIQPENDLAVLQARTLPDDLQAATMRSTGDLAPGDQVVAVGFPFGIGPSVSAGVVSGLRRDYMSPQGKRVLTNLIQFDAAANPGNSGGPLVTMDGEVVGIVTAILNPGEQRTFIGIGFAVPIENAAAGAGLTPF